MNAKVQAYVEILDDSPNVWHNVVTLGKKEKQELENEAIKRGWTILFDNELGVMRLK